MQPPPIPKTFDGYELISPIGKGGMGWVWLARRIHTDQQVAIKHIHPEFAAQSQYRQRFEREMKIMAELRHKHLMTIWDWGVVNNIPYYVMPYIAGMSARDFIKKYGAFTPEQALYVVQAVCEALDYMHSQHIYHRDVKPHNILINTHWHVVLSDFGIAANRNTEQITTLTEGMHMGTHGYVAPELRGGATASARTDIYSLGVTVYEMLVRRQYVKVLADDNIPDPYALLPVPIQPVIRRATQQSASMRQQTVWEFYNDLKTAIQGATQPVPTQQVDPVTNPPSSSITNASQQVGSGSQVPGSAAYPGYTVAAAPNGLSPLLAILLTMMAFTMMILFVLVLRLTDERGTGMAVSQQPATNDSGTVGNLPLLEFTKSTLTQSPPTQTDPAAPTDRPANTPTRPPSPTPDMATLPPSITVSDRPENVVRSLARLDIVPQEGGLSDSLSSESLDLTGEDDVLRWLRMNGQYTDFVLHTSFAWGPGANNDACGLIVREQNNDNFYIALLNRRGELEWAVFVNDTPNATTINVPALNTGRRAKNNLIVVALRADIIIFVNGEQVYETRDVTFRRGYVGPLASTSDDSDASGCDFFNTWVWDLNQVPVTNTPTRRPATRTPRPTQVFIPPTDVPQPTLAPPTLVPPQMAEDPNPGGGPRITSGGTYIVPGGGYVFSLAGPDGVSVDVLQAGMPVSIIGGPIEIEGQWWWRVRTPGGADGWIEERRMQ